MDFNLTDNPPIFVLGNFRTQEIRETSGSLTSPVIKNNCIVCHNVNDLTINNCILHSCLSGGIVCGDACQRVSIDSCKI